MKIQPGFTTQDIRNAIVQQVQVVEEAAINRLIRIGEYCVARIRTQGAWKDHSGNLRSSAGYVIIRDGRQLIEGGFALVKEGAEGVETGRVEIEKIAANFPRGIVFILCVGMHYGIFVEAGGIDVLSGTAIEATTLIKEAMQALAAKH